MSRTNMLFTWLACIVAGATIAYGQPSWFNGQLPGQAERRQLQREMNNGGDRIRVNMKRVSGTPTPSGTDRCELACVGATPQIVASAGGVPFQPIGGGSAGCQCASTGTDSSCVGVGCSASGIGGVCIGANCLAGAGSCIGDGCATSDTSVAMGSGVTATGARTNCFGNSALCTGDDGGCIGSQCQMTGNGEYNFGAFGSPITNYHYGRGKNGGPENTTHRSSYSSNANFQGGNYSIGGGEGTGNQPAGTVYLEYGPPSTPGATPHANVAAWMVDPTTGAFMQVFGAGTIGTAGVFINGIFSLIGSFGVVIYGSGGQVISANNTTLNNGFIAVSRLRVTLDTSRTLTSHPTITAGVQDGQKFELINLDLNDTLTLTDADTDPGTALILGANTRVLGACDQIFLTWQSAINKWVEDHYQDNTGAC